MADIIRFEPGKPVDVALKFDTPRESKGQYGEQFMYTTVDGRIFYLDCDCGAVEQIRNLRITKDMPFRITKTKGAKNAVYWIVQRLDSIESQLSESVALARSGERPGSRPSAAPANVVPMPASTNTSAQPKSSLTLTSSELAACLIAAVDAAQLAEQYAASKQFDLQFGPEDIRAMAATLYIQTGKLYAAAAAGGAR